jgi:diketogulonate reductase-like aldo/keto reductase
LVTPERVCIVFQDSVDAFLLTIVMYNSYVPLVKSQTPSRIVSNTHLYDFALEEKDMTELDALDCGSEGAISWNPVSVP